MQLVGGSDAGEDAVGHADHRAVRRHPAADVGQQRDERDLPDVGGLAGHVGAGDERQPVRVHAEAAVVGHEALAQPLLEHRVAAADDLGHRLLGDGRPRPAAAGGQFREAQQHVELGHRVGEGGQRCGHRRRPHAQFGEEHLLALDRAGLGAHDLLLESLEFVGDEPLGVLERLLAVEAGRHAVAVGGGDFDVIAEDPVETDLQRGDAGLLEQPGLVGGQPGGGVPLQQPGLVEFRIDAVAEEPALAEVRRRLGQAAVDDLHRQRFEVRGQPVELCADRFERGRAGEEFPEAGELADAAAEGDHVPRGGPPQGHAAGDPGHVLHRPDQVDEFVPQPLVGQQRRDDLLPGLDRPAVGQRIAEPLAEQPLAHRRDAPPHRGQQRAVGRARPHGAFDLEAREARPVQHQAGRRVDPAGRLQVRQRPERRAGGLPHRGGGRRGGAGGQTSRIRGLGVQQVAEQGPGGGDGRRVVGQPEALERRHAEVLAERPLGFREPEAPDRPCGGRERRRGPGRGQRRRQSVAVVGVGEDHFARTSSGQFVGQAGQGHGDDGEGAGGDFGRGDRRGQGLGRRRILGRAEHHRGHEVRPALFEQPLVHQRARREDAGDGPLHHPLGVSRVLHLVGHRHAEALADHPPQVVFQSVVGHPGHGGAAIAAGEGDAQGPVGGNGVLAEELVEIAHPEEEHAAGVLPLEAAVLLHRRGLGPRRSAGGATT